MNGWMDKELGKNDSFSLNGLYVCRYRQPTYTQHTYDLKYIVHAVPTI